MFEYPQLMTSVFYTKKQYVEDKVHQNIFQDLSGKKETYTLSRIALSRGLSFFNFSIDSNEKLSLNHLYELIYFPSLRVSLSHCQNMGLAILCPKKYVQSIGCDIEPSTRKIKDGSSKYFINSQDKTGIFNDLQIWVIKEASFKAISKLYPRARKNLTLKKITIEAISKEEYKVEYTPLNITGNGCIQLFSEGLSHYFYSICYILNT